MYEEIKIVFDEESETWKEKKEKARAVMYGDMRKENDLSVFQY